MKIYNQCTVITKISNFHCEIICNKCLKLLFYSVISTSDEVGITASDICSQTCNRDDPAFMKFPATVEELQKFCE